MKPRIVVAAAVVLLSLCCGGCATAGGGSAEHVLCQGDQLERAVLDARLAVSDLELDRQQIVNDAVYDDGAPLDLDDDWFVGRADEDSVIVLRERVPDADDRREYERVEVSWLDDRWMVTAHGRCDLARDLGDLKAADVALDAATDPSTTRLLLLVTEQDCNSGRDAAGRIDLVSVDETSDAVRIVVGTRSVEGPATCPMNPPTPFTVELTAPLGDRTVYDDSRVPARELLPAAQQ